MYFRIFFYEHGCAYVITSNSIGGGKIDKRRLGNDDEFIKVKQDIA